MKAKQNHGIISEHFCGVGTVTSERVTQRAREIALINGRPPNHFTQEDFNEAKRELTGEPVDASDEGAVANVTAWDESPSDSGHTVEKEIADDEQSVAEQLVEQGVNEAEHDQMVEGARSPENQE
jgi:hypothetical protein